MNIIFSNTKLFHLHIRFFKLIIKYLFKVCFNIHFISQIWEIFNHRIKIKGYFIKLKEGLLKRNKNFGRFFYFNIKDFLHFAGNQKGNR